MIESTYSIRLILPVSVVIALLSSTIAHAYQPTETHPHVIEVLTTTELLVTGETAINRPAVDKETEFHVYELDGIQRIEAKLSEGLTADLEQAKHLAMQRIQQLDQVSRAQMQQAAIGIAKAAQYGVDRYPAIVFDGEVVIYGVTDLREALQRYRQWREGRRP